MMFSGNEFFLLNPFSVVEITGYLERIRYQISSTFSLEKH